MTALPPPVIPAPTPPQPSGPASRADRWYWPIIVGASSVAFAIAFLVFLPDGGAKPSPVHTPDPVVQTLPLDPAAVTVPAVAPADLAPSASDAVLEPTG